VLYNFLFFVKYKLIGKSNSTSTGENLTLVKRTEAILTKIWDKAREILLDSDYFMVIERAMNPAMLVLSKLVIETHSYKSIVKTCFEKFEHSSDLFLYIKSILGETIKVDDLFDSQPMIMNENEDFRVFEYARDFQGFESTLKVETISTFFELVIANKSEIEYLNRYLAVIVENSFDILEILYETQRGFVLSNKDTVSSMIIMIMVVLYNYRHTKKVIEEKYANNESVLKAKRSKIISEFQNFTRKLMNI
jgi:hypothetical protein